MASSPLFDWLNDIPLLLLGLLLLVAMIITALCGYAVRQSQDRKDPKAEISESQQGYIVSAVLALLGLLLGFTFSLAIERFEARRALVLEDANAIGTAYLRTQLLGEPHRTRLSHLIVEYTDNMVLLAKAPPIQIPPLLAVDDKLLTDIWAATAAGYDSIRDLAYSSTFVSAINSMIDEDGARRAARQAHVPTPVFAVLLIYLIVTAGVLGYVLSTRRGRVPALFLMALVIMSLLLIIDIDRPTTGTLRESQLPMEQLRNSLKTTPISTYDRWRQPAP